MIQQKTENNLSPIFLTRSVYGSVYTYVKRHCLAFYEGKCFCTYLTNATVKVTATLGLRCFLICWMLGTPFLSTVIIFEWMDFCTARVRVLYSHLQLICSFPLISQCYSHPTLSTSNRFIQLTSKPVHTKQTVKDSRSK